MAADVPNLAEVARMRAVLTAMPPLVRQVFELHRFDGLPLDVIAARLQLDGDAAERFLARAMLLLDSCDT